MNESGLIHKLFFVSIAQLHALLLNKAFFSGTRLKNIIPLFLGAIAVINILLVIFLWVNHITFPLNLDLMEGTVLQHFQRAAAFKPIYPEPTPEYVPLAYNPLYYVLAIPFSWIFGVNLFTLRFVAILGIIGSGLILYRVVREKTASTWWGLIVVGLFAAAYHVMGDYLDTAHSDSWFLFSALLGSYVIDRNRSNGWNLVGLIILIASFWFKQHGALFVIGGLIFLTRREGLRRAGLYGLVIVLLGPVLYIFIGPHIFGPRFHYFTWEVPRHWSQLSLNTFYRYTAFIIKFYLILATVGGLWTAWIGFKQRKRLSIWQVQFFLAALTGFMGTLDLGSADNVYIPMGTWFILVGTLGLHELMTRVQFVRRYQVYQLALIAVFTVFLYNPLECIVSPQADESYVDLINTFRELNGSVYAPTLGQLPSDYTLYPAAHWVALEDMIRGPGRNTENHSNTRRLLSPLLKPTGSAYILTNYPLEADTLLGFLNNCYVLDTDYKDRFKPLHVLPGRYSDIQAFPRYLYRYMPQGDGC